MRSTTSSTKGKHIAHPAQILPKGAACLECKARKVRCSGEAPVCSSCLRHWKHEGKDVSQCVCVWSSKKGKARATKASRRLSSDSEGSSGSTSSTDSSAETTPDHSPSPPASSTSSWTPPPLILETASSKLAESYFLGTPISISPVSTHFDLPPPLATLPPAPTPSLDADLDFSSYFSSSFFTHSLPSFLPLQQPPPPPAPAPFAAEFDFDAEFLACLSAFEPSPVATTAPAIAPQALYMPYYGSPEQESLGELEEVDEGKSDWTFPAALEELEPVESSWVMPSWPEPLGEPRPFWALP